MMRLYSGIKDHACVTPFHVFEGKLNTYLYNLAFSWNLGIKWFDISIISCIDAYNYLIFYFFLFLVFYVIHHSLSGY